MALRTAATYRILTIDDDQRIRQTLARFLTEEGFAVHEGADATEMRNVLATEKVDLVLLDLVLGHERGLDLIPELRAKAPWVGLIVTTAKKDVIDRVVALELGADDYITKPFDLRELLARIRSLQRRLALTRALPQTLGMSRILRFSGWQLDIAARQLTAPTGNDVPLTGGEFDLLVVFASRPGHVLDRDYLLDATNGQDWHAFDRTIDARVSRLRKKLGLGGASLELIKSVRGAGYIFTARVE